jgi:hypothetical protein
VPAVKRTVLVVCVGFMLALVAGCVTTEQDTDDTATDTRILIDTNLIESVDAGEANDDAGAEEITGFEPPALDPEAREADLPGESRIWPLSDTWVGELDDDRFIAITLDENYLGEQYDVLVYICDTGETFVVHAGALEDGRATLSGDFVDIELSLEDEEFSGSVSLDGESLDFSAAPASEPSGLYVAEFSSDGSDPGTAMWIVNDAGEQRGARIDQLPCIPVPRFGCIPVPNVSR